MNTNLNHGSAKIYQFPAGGRSALGGRRYEEAKAVTDLAPSRASAVAVGGAWYHDAAIQDSKPTRES
jgi:glycerol-3-phosphate dehydrogenase